MKYNISFFSSAKDNVVDKTKTFECEWSEIVENLTKLHVSEVKNDLGFVIGKFELDTAVAKPVVYDEGLETQHVVPGTIRRCSENLLEQHALCLDYDGGAKIEDVIALVSDMGYKYLAYTSHSHLKDGATEKFRVVIPFATPCPTSEWKLRRDIVLELFPGVDASTTACSRIFFAHACPEERQHLALSWSQDGEAFDWNILPRKEPFVPVAVDRSKLVDSGNGKINWDSFDLVRFMQDEGLYIRQVSANRHYVKCPQEHLHSSAGGTFIEQNGSTRASFYCAHSHCADFRLFSHYESKYGKGWKIPYCKREPVETHETRRLKLAERYKLILQSRKTS